jgi:DNA-cytosine methyltransferase
MKVLSLFDGCGMAAQALKNLNIKIEKYYASEIDKFAILIANKNHPDIIQLGDINNWRNWKIKTPDLIIAGSPCQGFSFSGKQLNFEDTRSKLYFVFEDILKHYKPKYWLLENVKMKKEYRYIISARLFTEPILINSSLVSAQNRKRLYWSNIKINQPDDEKIYLKDILESGVVDKDKSYCIDSNYWKGGNLKSYFVSKRRQLIFENAVQIGYIKQNHRGSRIYSKNGKSVCATVGGWGMKTGLYKDGLNFRKLTPIECERLQTLPDNYTEGVSNTQRYKMLGNGFTIKIIEHILKGIDYYNHVEGII